MKTDIHHLIAALCPDVYCASDARQAVRQALRAEPEAPWQRRLLAAADVAQPVPPNTVPLENLHELNPFDCPGFRCPREQHSFGWDALSESIESFYFSLLNSLEQKEGWQVMKLVDDFQAAPLSAVFGDTIQLQRISQQQVTRGLAAVQDLTRSILGSVEEVEALRRQTPPSNTIDSPDDRRRRQRLEIEEAQLRSKLASLKLQVAWLRPWLRTAQRLTSTHESFSNLVNAFNTTQFEVVLLAIGPDAVERAVAEKVIPPFVQRSVRRSYHPILVVEIHARTRPDRTPSRTIVHRGRIDVTFTSYGLNTDEIDRLRQEFEFDQLEESLGLGTDPENGSLQTLIEHVERLVQPARESPKSAIVEDANPFVALFHLFRDLFRRGLQDHPPEVRLSTPAPRADNSHERVARSLAIVEARSVCSVLYREANELVRPHP